MNAPKIKLILFFYIMQIPILLLSQSLLPEKIKIKYYSGGDYREKGIRGAYDDVDTNILEFIPDDKIYYSSQTTQMRKVFIPTDIIKVHKNIVQDSSLSLYYSVSLPKEDIEKLLSFIQIENYHEYSIIDTTYKLTEELKLSDSIDYIHKDTFLIPKDFSLKDFDIDSSTFKFDCEYYLEILKNQIYNTNSQNCKNLNDLKPFIDELIKKGRNTLIISSYFKYISVVLYFNSQTIEIFQRYPGGLNTGWTINYSTNKEFKVINPRINDIVFKMLPYRYTEIRILKEYKIKEQLMRLYFNSKK